MSTRLQFLAIVFQSLLWLTELDGTRLAAASTIPVADGNGITLFEHFDFKGKNFTINESNPDINPLVPSKTYHGLSSFVVDHGMWKLYVEVNYGGEPIAIGDLTEFGPGKYNFRMVRVLNDIPQSVKLLPLITLYAHWHLMDGEVDLADSSPNISADFPQGTGGLSTFVVHAGKWSLYTGSNYTGELVDIHGMTVFGPGKYELRGKGVLKFNDETVSVKLIE